MSVANDPKDIEREMITRISTKNSLKLGLILKSAYFLISLATNLLFAESNLDNSRRFVSCPSNYSDKDFQSKLPWELILPENFKYLNSNYLSKEAVPLSK